MTTLKWATPLFILIVLFMADVAAQRFGNVPMVPQAPSYIKTRFTIIGSQGQSENEVLRFTKDNLEGAIWNQFVKNTPLIFIVHGFFGTDEAKWVTDMARSLRYKMKYSVITVDWRVGARGVPSDITEVISALDTSKIPLYDQAVANTRLVGEQIGLLLASLDKRNFDLRLAHIVGHSLGAHIAGYAGAYLNQQYRMRNVRSRLGRITGLDPAGPRFRYQSFEVRLDESDAEFVDVIHTDGSFFGIMQASGHMDFYPNGGYNQPGCNEADITCSHSRAYLLFQASIEILTQGHPFKGGQCSFYSEPCTNLGFFFTENGPVCYGRNTFHKMGIGATRATNRVTLFLKTLVKEPFCEIAHA